MSTRISQEQADSLGPSACAECEAAARPPVDPVGSSVVIVNDKAKSWIVIKLVDPDEQPVAGERLSVAPPEGGTLGVRLDNRGKIRVEGIEAGICRVSFQDPDVVVAKQLRVKSRDSLDSIARAHDTTWSDLSRLNWGTSDPDEINEFLRDDVGCTRKTRDGKNYVFSDDDDPGTILVPLRAISLKTEQEHVLQLHEPRGPTIQLENEDGLRLPEVAFEITFSAGGARQGRLDRNGRFRLLDAPAGDFDVVYPDEEDILAKSLAASVRAGFSEHTTHQLLRLLAYSTDTVRKAKEAYDKYFNDYTGDGFVSDIYQEISDPQCLTICETLMSFHGLKVRQDVIVVQGRPEMDKHELHRG